MTAPPKNPSWDRLFELAAGQEGYFTAQQAAALGYSRQLLSHYRRTGRLLRVHHGIYRIVHFPAGNHEDLVVAWLWSDRFGVISHETSLALHDLSDLMPSQIHLSLPLAARARRRKPPPNVVVHYAEVPITDRSWVASVPATTPKRTLIDCAMAGLEPEFLHQAAEQALRRGLIARGDIVEVDRALRPFTGLGS
ncbi:MAG TPA: type IV toxin-antitoxin system AbiEi family antitoxin domain-containing protein [Kofleriaceae bacterium]|nr:type IV toxin-antitoxin system AbiEi family antitoxin domain-containing protein [Kofleriaceae bacterium]